MVYDLLWEKEFPITNVAHNKNAFYCIPCKISRYLIRVLANLGKIKGPKNFLGPPLGGLEHPQTPNSMSRSLRSRSVPHLQIHNLASMEERRTYDVRSF